MENKRIAKTHYLTEFPTIFKPIQKGAREKGVEIQYKYQNGSILKIKMFKQLDIGDQDLFLGIVSLMSQYTKGEFGSQSSDNDITKELRDKLDLKNMLFELPILKMKTTLYQLLNVIGRSQGSGNRKWLLESLERLGDCSIYYNTDKYIGHSNLLSYSIDKETKEIHISLNPVSSTVFLNNDKYVIHNLTERYSLKLDSSKALQSYLNKFIIPGSNKVFYIDTLIEGIYGKTDNIGTYRDRKKIVKKAIEELSEKREYSFKFVLNNGIEIKRIRNLLNIE